jgi:hypothetical protein
MHGLLEKRMNMADIDPRLVELGALREAGRYDEALALLLQLYAEAEGADAPTRLAYFMPMLEWGFLIEHHAPACAALARARDEQVARLSSGSIHCGGTDSTVDETGYVARRVARFSLIVEMNEMLGDARSTWQLFARLDADHPDLAQRYAWQALPAIVEAGDFALADRYRGEPLAHLGVVNQTALTWPLFPAAGTAPRLAAELTSLVRDVRIAIAVLRGQGREAEAAALRAALLSGLDYDDVRRMAQHELEAPGTITRDIVAHQMQQDGHID